MITCVDENEFDDIAVEVVKLFTIPTVSVSLPCYHNYIQKDTYWKRCIHCGMIAPYRMLYWKTHYSEIPKNEYHTLIGGGWLVRVDNDGGYTWSDEANRISGLFNGL